MLRDDVPLERRCQDAEAQWFGKHEYVSWLRAGVAHHLVLVPEARYREAVLRFLVLNRVARAKLGARLFDLRLAAGQDLTQDPEVEGARERDQVHRGQGFAAHRVNVREGVRR